MLEGSFVDHKDNDNASSRVALLQEIHELENEMEEMQVLTADNFQLVMGIARAGSAE